MAEIRVLLADDEPLVRRGLRRLLAGQPGIRIVGEARSGREALELIDRLHPDLLFLDVQMPERDGLEVAAALDPGTAPAIIFVTAFDQYALRAFDLHAVDYLLKPFDEERGLQALARARARLAAHDPARDEAQIRALLATLERPRPWRTRMAVRQRQRTIFVAVDDIEWIEAADNYARLHTGHGAYLIRVTLRHLDEELDPARFARIHRSAIVQLDRIREIRPLPDGDQTVVMASGARLTLARSWREGFESRAGRAR